MGESKNFAQLNNCYLKLKRWLPMKLAYRLAVHSAHKTKSRNRR